MYFNTCYATYLMFLNKRQECLAINEGQYIGYSYAWSKLIYSYCPYCQQTRADLLHWSCVPVVGVSWFGCMISMRLQQSLCNLLGLLTKVFVNKKYKKLVRWLKITRCRIQAHCSHGVIKQPLLVQFPAVLEYLKGFFL